MGAKNTFSLCLASLTFVCLATNYPAQDYKCTSDANCNDYFEHCVFATPANTSASLANANSATVS